MSDYLVTRDGYEISDDKRRLDVDAIEAFLSRAYWAQGRSRQQIETSIANSLCFGVYRDGRQVGLARVITDHATFAYLADVFIDDAERGHGLGKWLIASILVHPDLQGLRRWILATRDAHGLYAQFGFHPLQAPDRWMEIFNPPRS